MSTGKTFRHLIADYKVSPEFTGRADETKRDYKRYLDKIERAWGSFLVSSIRPKHVIALRDEFQETPSTANHLLSVLKTLINWGIPREFSEGNPCIHVPKLDVEEEGARPWPAWAYKLVEEHGREDYRRAVLLGRYTGQRTADIVRMGTHDMEDGGLHVTQQKTGKQLWIPIHADLAPEIERWGDCERFVLTPKGTAYTSQSFRAAWTRLMNDTPAGRIRTEGYTFHGLRAGSCEKLWEAGCSYEDIETITGMSQAMIRRYLRFATRSGLRNRRCGGWRL